ncbi:MAG: aspartate kinase [Chloroflexota bacterium]
MKTLVMKFGGLAVGTTTALTQVLSIILHEHERWNRLLIVVSALEGVTDALLEATRLAQVSNRRGYRRISATLRTRHMALVEHLPLGPTERQALQADMDRLLFEMLDQLQSVADAAQEDLSAEKVDAIVGTGERLAARIVAAMVRQNNIRAVAIDSQSLVITDANFGNAVPDLEASCERITENLLPMLDRKIIPVITGFIGSTLDGRITTLGRGGSDYTASVLGACSNADEVWIWTTVDGMMTTDPNEIDNARVITDMSYAEVGEMAYFGARVLHARMIGPLQSQKILLRIKNVFKPAQQGTLISHSAARQPRSLKAVTVIQGIGLSADRSGPLSEITAMVNDVLMSTAGSPAEVMISSQSASRSFLCFVIPTRSGPSAVRAALDILETELEDFPIDWQVRQVSVVTIIGAQINEMQDVMAGLLAQLKGIPVLGIAQGPSNCSVSVVIPPESVFEAQARLHDYVLAYS